MQTSDEGGPELDSAFELLMINFPVTGKHVPSILSLSVFERPIACGVNLTKSLDTVSLMRTYDVPIQVSSG